MIKYILLFALATILIYSQKTIPLKFNDYGLIFVEAEVNDVKGNFILDTGAGAHVLSRKFFDKVKDNTEEIGIYTGFRHNGERIDLITYKAESISVGEQLQQDPYVGVFPLLDDYGIDGLVSLKLFENSPFTINFIDTVLVIVNDESIDELENNSEIFPILFDKERDKVLDMFVTICINGSVSLQAEFDTGSGFNTFFINEYYVNKLSLQPDTLGKVDLFNVGLCEGFPMEEKVSATVKEDLIYEGLIGSGIFKDRKLTIDIPGSRILVRD